MTWTQIYNSWNTVKADFAYSILNNKCVLVVNNMTNNFIMNSENYRLCLAALNLIQVWCPQYLRPLARSYSCAGVLTVSISFWRMSLSSLSEGLTSILIWILHTADVISCAIRRCIIYLFPSSSTLTPDLIRTCNHQSSCVICVQYHDMVFFLDKISVLG